MGIMQKLKPTESLENILLAEKLVSEGVNNEK